MASSFINSKSVKIFIADVIDAMPYIKASVSHFADQIVGKKAGESYYFVLRDAGNPTEGLTIADGDDTTVVEKQVKLTIKNEKNVVDLNVLQSVVDVEDFKTEIADTYGLRLGAEIQKKVIETSYFKATVATYPNAGSDNGWPALARATAHLRAIRNGAKVFGHLAPEAEANLSQSALNNFKFADSALGQKWYGENSIGRFGGADWAYVTDTPTVTIPAASAISGISAASAVTADGVGTLYISGPTGNTATLPAGLPLQLTSAYACNSVGMATNTKFSFILQSAVTLNGTALIPATVQSLVAEDIGSRNIYISGVTAASAVSGALTCPLSAGVVYDVAQVRCNEVMNWDNIPLDDIAGAETANEEVGGVKLKVTKFGNVGTMVNKTRWDVGYLAGIVDERLVVDAYLPRV
jgi:hypothetical protein